MEIRIGDRLVGDSSPTYFIAEIGSNHDGQLDRAKKLIQLAAEAGADAAKFQNFKADRIVSDEGFRQLGAGLSHQASWEKPVSDVYDEAAVPPDWTPILAQECEDAGIDYFSSSYDFGSVDVLDEYVPAYKVGSGDIDWIEELEYIARKDKPVILSTGASSIGEVQRAVRAVTAINPQLVLMQCNTNYTGGSENFKHIHLNVLKTYSILFPDIVLGLSDHTPGHSTCLGAIALGARMVEKHFTDDRSREGPDHPYAMMPNDFKEMVNRARELEQALGSSQKYVADNEKETVIVQRRCLRAARDIHGGTRLAREDIDLLRPAPANSIGPPFIEDVVGLRAIKDLSRGEALTWAIVGE